MGILLGFISILIIAGIGQKRRKCLVITAAVETDIDRSEGAYRLR